MLIEAEMMVGRGLHVHIAHDLLRNLSESSRT